MTDASEREVSEREANEDGTGAVLLDDIGHPKGTLAVLALYALLFILGWVGLYAFEFIPRGTPHL